MLQDSLFERDILYPTEHVNEPGSAHIEMLTPTKSGKLPVIIESKTAHSLIKYVSDILRIIQSDILDRVRMDIKANTAVYIRIQDHDEFAKDYAGKEYVKIQFEGGNIRFTGTDAVEKD